MAKVIARIKSFDSDIVGKGESAKFFVRHNIGIKVFFDRNDCAKACRLQMIAHGHDIAPEVYGFGKVEDSTGKQMWGYLTEVATVMASLPEGLHDILCESRGYQRMRKIAEDIGCARDCHTKNYGFLNVGSYNRCKFVIIDFGWHSRHNGTKSTSKSPRSLPRDAHYNLKLLLEKPV